jgi:hypothetical protein
MEKKGAPSWSSEGHVDEWKLTFLSEEFHRVRRIYRGHQRMWYGWNAHLDTCARSQVLRPAELCESTRVEEENKQRRKYIKRVSASHHSSSSLILLLQDLQMRTGTDAEPWRQPWWINLRGWNVNCKSCCPLNSASCPKKVEKRPKNRPKSWRKVQKVQKSIQKVKKVKKKVGKKSETI